MRKKGTWALYGAIIGRSRAPGGSMGHERGSQGPLGPPPAPTARREHLANAQRAELPLYPGPGARTREEAPGAPHTP